MANNNDGQIVLGLDIPKTVSQINDDIKKLQGQLDQVKATGALDTSATVKQINAQIATLQAQLNNINIQANVNMNNSTKTSAQQTGQQIGKLISDSAEQAISRVSSPAIGRYFKIDPSTSNQFRTEMEKLVSEWTNAKGKLTDINIQTRTSYDKDAEKNITRLHQATVTYKNELDEVIKKTIAWRQIGTTTNAKGEEQVLRGFVEVAGQYSKSIDTITAKTDTFVDKQKKAVGSLTSTLASIKSGYDDKNASKPIKLQSNIDKLEEQYAKVETAIKAVGQANKSTFTDAEVEANRLISELRDMVKEYRNAENVSTKMKGTDFTSGLSIAKNDLQKFKADAKDFPQITQTIKDLDTAIGKVGDASSLNKFNDELRVARSELAKIKSETSATNKTEKVGINTSGLQSKIADLQKISPEIDKFETEINGAKVTVQSLLTDLSKINTQGDFSVVNAKFNAFTKAAEASGIAIRDFGNVTDSIAEKVNKIQHSWSDGSYEAKYDSLIAKTRQWVDANDESVISTQKLTTAYNEFNQAASNFAKDGSVKNRDILIQKEEELGRQLKATTNDIKVQNAEWAKSSKVDSLHQKIQEFYDKNTATHRKWGSQLKNMLNETAHGAQVTVTRVNEIEQEFLGVSNAARQAGKLGQSFFGSIKEQASKFIGWFSVTSVVMEGVQSIKKMAQAVIEVDTAMIELTKVSSASSNELKNYFDEAAESAKKLGASVSDVISATADFSRLGYNLKDASVLAEVATLYKNVGDGITIDEASSSIVSTMKAFGIEAENSMQIIDAFNQVGNNFAISSGEIGDALKRSASSLAVGGNSLSEAIGLITAGNTVVQDADIVGTALKSMSLRITSTSAELEAMGEDTEFACETLSDYRDLVMGLTDNKVNIVGDDGEYKSTYEILKDISQVWDDMNSMEQSSLMKALFGVRQANIGASILENFDVAEQAMKSAEESAGSALKEQSNYEKGKHICLYVQKCA